MTNKSKLVSLCKQAHLCPPDWKACLACCEHARFFLYRVTLLQTSCTSTLATRSKLGTTLSQPS